NPAQDARQAPGPAVSGTRPGSFARRLLLAGLVALVAAGAPPSPDVGAPTGLWLGRFSMVLTEPGVERRQEQVQGRFELRSHGERRSLTVFSPFGQTLAQLDDRPGHARLTTSDGTVLEADTAEGRRAPTIGWLPPVREL